MRILIANDKRDALMTLGIMLRSEGFQVELVDGGAAVAKAVRDFRPDAVVLDLEMPDRDGYAVAQDLRREHGSACPILIAISTHDQAADERLAEDSGITHHVPRPYDQDGLLGLLIALKGGAGTNSVQTEDEL